jgi:hypothetical protein
MTFRTKVSSEVLLEPLVFLGLPLFSSEIF